MATPLSDQTLSELSAALDGRELSATELMQAYAARTRAVDSAVGAFNSFDEVDALAQARASDERRAAGAARGPLDGIPIGIKDVISVAGQPLTASSRMLRNFVSPYDATVIERLKAAGAVCWGRLNLDEFAMGSSTENSAFGATSNPWDLERVPGGSSGGSAAALAAGEAAATLGSDTGGSIRQPAALCNVVGLKPTYGLVSRYGLIAFASSLDQIGPFTRTVGDAAVLLSAIAGHDPRDSTSVRLPVPDYAAELRRLGSGGRKWRLGIPKEYFGEGLDPEVAAAVQASIEDYRRAGCEIREVSLPHTRYAVGVYYIIATAECSSNLGRYDGVRYGHRSKDATDALDLYFKSRAEGFGPEVKRRIILGTYVLSSGYYDAYYLRAQKVRTLIRRDFLDAYREVDAILTPTSPTPAFRKGEKKADPLSMYLSDIYTIGVNLAGLPGISVPCGFTRGGLPIGLQVIGQPFKEAEMLAIAQAYEHGHEWHPAPAEFMSAYEAVIGLEVHVQIKTRSKMFSRVATGYGQPENTLTDPVVLALPGALPVMNKRALDQIIKAGLLLGCDIASVCKWDRKNYFYPDSPKNYQISQYDQPMCRGGSVEIELPGGARNIMGEHRRVPLTRIHLEEDVGKLNHTSTESLVDYNRAGTPLMEVVSEPAMHTAEEAFAYLTALKAVMIYGGISDCDMEKGQLRCDANISIRPAGASGLGTKVELKNLNSISYVRDGIAHEIRRQIAVVQSGGTIVQETRDYDGQTGASQSLRSKEMAHDYRYFPDPDLMPVQVDDAWKAALHAECPELPFDKQRRFYEQYGIPYTLTSVLVPDHELSDFFEEAARLCGKPQAAANWMANDLLRDLAAARMALADSKVRPAHVAGLVKLVESGALLTHAAKEVFVEMFRTGEPPEAIVERKGLKAETDAGELEQWCREAIAANPKSAADFKGGKDSAINAFKGSVMRAAKGKADPKLVDAVLRKLLTE